MGAGDAAGTLNVGSVGEQSHKSEMGAALRGDFERLRARRGAGGDAVLQAPRPEPEVVPAEAAAAVGEASASLAPAPGATDERAGEAEASPQPRPSWLERLRRRP